MDARNLLNRAQLAPRGSQNGPNKSINHISCQKRGETPQRTPIRSDKWPTWRQGGFPNRAHIGKQSVQKSIKKQCLSRLVIETIFVDPSWDQTSVLSRKRRKANCAYETKRIVTIWGVGGSKSGPVTDQNR